MVQKKAPTVSTDQHGMVAIMVTMILMIVVSLLVMGFAQVSRRNQRTTLDRQLSTQAFYAAESGINDARELINDKIDAGESVESKTSCSPASNGMYVNLPNNVLDADKDVSYTCLLVNATPTSLEYDKIEDQSTVVPIISGNGTIQSLNLVWKTGDEGNTAPTNNCPAGPGVSAEFTPTTDWNCGYGVLRFDLVQVSNSMDAGSLQNGTMTTFAVPVRSGGATTRTFSAGNSASVGVACTDTNCSLRIEGGLGGDQYYLRVRNIYKSGPLTINGTTTAGQEVQFTNAQVVIDVTGKAQDVLRRLQVRVPTSEVGSVNQLPDNGLQSSDSICKRFAVMDDYYSSEVPGSISGSNILCQP